MTVVRDLVVLVCALITAGGGTLGLAAAAGWFDKDHGDGRA